MQTEIKLDDIEKYIGEIIWFERNEEKTKPRKLSRCVNGLPTVFDETKHSGHYLCVDRQFFESIKIFTYGY